MLGFANSAEYRAARELLQAGGFDYDSLCATLGEPDWVAMRLLDLPRQERRVREPTPQHRLIRLLLLGLEMSARDAEQSLHPMTVSQWVNAGVLRMSESGDAVSGRLRLTPFPGFVVAADRPVLSTREAPADFVMPPGATSLELGWSAIAEPAERVLDLGTGCGYLGLVASAYARQVVATDRNERAAQLAHFNARLNGIEHLESRVGSSWDPVAGEQFDRVLSNPPFVITPQQRLMFRDSGMRGDEFCRHLIREAPEHLVESAYCQMLGNFGHRKSADWPAELAHWFADLGCDALVFVTRQEPIDVYAMHWITTTESQDSQEVPRMFDDWMAFYERQHIEQVSYLHINLRRRSASRNWIHVDSEEIRIAGPAGAAIQRRFGVLDELQRLPNPAALLHWRLTLDDSARLVQHHRMTTDGPRLAGNRLEMQGGLRYSAELDGHVMGLVASCDGRSSLAELLTGLANSLNMPEEQVNKIALPVVRHLIERGFLRGLD